MYSPEKNVQIIVSLLKKHGIDTVVASPGATNVSLVASMQNDPYFKIFSGPDERSAAYMACGMAEATGKPIVITCTGATSSRNYMPGLTEAYYRKLPIIAITASMDYAFSGHMYPQFMDRTQQPADLVLKSVQIPRGQTENEEWECMIKVNDAILETKRHGGGPVHINYITVYPNYKRYVETLPDTKQIVRIDARHLSDIELPNGRIAIFCGSHKKFTDEETEIIDKFCASNDSAVFCDHTSNYHGKYGVLYPVVASQDITDEAVAPQLLIHIGEISGDYYTTGKLKNSTQVWRISEDGVIRDYFHKITKVFEMSEIQFFSYFIDEKRDARDDYYNTCANKIKTTRENLDKELPFSNVWVASIIAKELPENSILHLGILNSLRSWNFFDVPSSVEVYSNVGGFGIDGGMSTMLGSSFIKRDQLHFGVFGDLAFFYDMNCLGNRDLGSNVRILLINNGLGTEFKNYSHSAYSLGDLIDPFVAAAGHYGNKSPELARHYAEDLGFIYLCAHNKEQFLNDYKKFLDVKELDKPMLFEVFTNSQDESDALKRIRTSVKDLSTLKNSVIDSVKSGVVSVFGNKLDKFIKR